MAAYVSSGHGRIPAPAVPSRRPRRLPAPRCAGHAQHDNNCDRCRRELVLAVTAREGEFREFRRLMGAPERVR